MNRRTQAFELRKLKRKCSKLPRLWLGLNAMTPRKPMFGFLIRKTEP